jgi:hypothetical protein
MGGNRATHTFNSDGAYEVIDALRRTWNWLPDYGRGTPPR